MACPSPAAMPIHQAASGAPGARQGDPDDPDDPDDRVITLTAQPGHLTIRSA